MAHSPSQEIAPILGNTNVIDAALQGMWKMLVKGDDDSAEVVPFTIDWEKVRAALSMGIRLTGQDRLRKWQTNTKRERAEDSPAEQGPSEDAEQGPSEHPQQGALKRMRKGPESK